VLYSFNDARDGEGRELRGGVEHMLDLHADARHRLDDLLDRRPGFEVLAQPLLGKLHQLKPEAALGAWNAEKP
jgi:hypothetical protein